MLLVLGCQSTAISQHQGLKAIDESINFMQHSTRMFLPILNYEYCVTLTYFLVVVHQSMAIYLPMIVQYHDEEVK